MAIREEAGLFEGDGGANASAFADHADAAFGRAIIVGAAIENHAAATRRAFLFREHGEVFFSIFSSKASGIASHVSSGFSLHREEEGCGKHDTRSRAQVIPGRRTANADSSLRSE